MIYDLIIVGLGSHGSAIFDHFTQKMKVLAIEKYTSPHQYGSHTGDSRIVREMGYYTDDYNKMALRSLELWQKLQDSTTDLLYVKQGGVSFGRELEIESLANNQTIPNQVKPELVEKLGFKTYSDQKYVLDTKAGYVNPEKIINLLIKRGLQRGGQIINQCKYINHEQMKDYIKVYTDLGTFNTKKIVLTLGLGIKELQPNFQIELQKQQVFYFRCENVYQNLPIYMGELRGYQIYGFPPINGLMKVGVHHYGLNIQYSQQYDKFYNSDTSVSLIREFFKLNLPLMENAELIKTESCVYTTTPDHNFVIDFHNNKNAIIISACSGHGYKFSICMGEIVDYMFTNGKLLYESFSLLSQQRPKL